MDWAKNIEYVVDYKRPHYVVKLNIVVKRGILLKIAEKTKTTFNDEEIIKIHPENFDGFKKIMNTIITEIEKKIQKKHPTFSFFSIEIKDIFLEKIDEKLYSIKVYIEGITPYD